MVILEAEKTLEEVRRSSKASFSMLCLLHLKDGKARLWKRIKSTSRLVRSELSAKKLHPEQGEYKDEEHQEN